MIDRLSDSEFFKRDETNEFGVTCRAASHLTRRAICHTLVATGILLISLGEVWASHLWLIDVAPAVAASNAEDNCENRMSDVLTNPFSVRVNALPPATTTVSLQRIRYEPGVELSVQPIDGPRLLLIESGVLTLELARSGASRFPLGSSPEGVALAGAGVQKVACGEYLLIPAHVPLQLANTSDEPVVWFQVQAETPPSLCACGEDLTGVSTSLLASQTVEQPIAAPAMLTVDLDEQGLQQGVSSPEGGVVQLFASLESATGPASDGAPLDGMDTPTFGYVVTLGAHAPTT